MTGFLWNWWKIHLSKFCFILRFLWSFIKSAVKPPPRLEGAEHPLRLCITFTLKEGRLPPRNSHYRPLEACQSSKHQVSWHLKAQAFKRKCQWWTWEETSIKYHFHSWTGIRPLRLDSVHAAFPSLTSSVSSSLLWTLFHVFFSLIFLILTAAILDL